MGKISKIALLVLTLVLAMAAVYIGDRLEYLETTRNEQGLR